MKNRQKKSLIFTRKSPEVAGPTTTLGNKSRGSSTIERCRQSGILDRGTEATKSNHQSRSNDYGERQPWRRAHQRQHPQPRLLPAPAAAEASRSMTARGKSDQQQQRHNGKANPPRGAQPAKSTPTQQQKHKPVSGYLDSGAPFHQAALATKNNHKNHAIPQDSREHPLRSNPTSFVCLRVPRPSVCLFMCVQKCVSVCLSVCPSFPLSVCLAFSISHPS